MPRKASSISTFLINFLQQTAAVFVIDFKRRPHQLITLFTKKTLLFLHQRRLAQISGFFESRKS